MDHSISQYFSSEKDMERPTGDLVTFTHAMGELGNDGVYYSSGGGNN